MREGVKARARISANKPSRTVQMNPSAPCARWEGNGRKGGGGDSETNGFDEHLAVERDQEKRARAGKLDLGVKGGGEEENDTIGSRSTSI